MTAPPVRRTDGRRRKAGEGRGSTANKAAPASVSSKKGGRVRQRAAINPQSSSDIFGDARLLLAAAARGPSLFGRGLIRLYRYTLSSLIGRTCRHLPTCSEYADEAIERFGLWKGGWMTLARLLRCHPWGTSGLDFVPQTMPAPARWYLPWRYARWRGVNEHAGGARRGRRRARAP
jgi:putative membrane protein insertion efficiency factor